MYRLNVTRLREVASKRGDSSAYAIARRTGVNISSAYRICSGETQPDLINALRIADAYDVVDIRTLMDLVEDEAEEDEPAGAAA